MRDFVAGVVAVVLLLVALALAGALDIYRRRRRSAQATAGALGRTVVAELPTGADLTLVTEDAADFHYGDRTIAKDGIRGVRLLINGATLAVYHSPRFPAAVDVIPASVPDAPDGIPRDRWDVVVHTLNGTELIECGAIRERVSQELARKIYDAVKAAVELRDTTP